jgi:multicomponent Na+:H+ antiporter subunit D
MVAAILAPLLGLFSRSWVRPWTLLALSASVAASVAALARALSEGPWRYHLGGWPPPWGIEYVIDPLSGGMACLVSVAALLAAVYSGPHLRRLTAIRAGSFHSLFLLLASGLLGVVTTGDVFNLFVFLEISSLSVYALIASGGDRATVAAFRYMIIGTVGASFYLLGLGYLYAATGSLNMADLAVRLGPIIESRAVTVGIVLIIAGLGVKTALFPLHGWLPDAYSRAPAPVVSFISAAQTKVAAYALYRILYFVLEAGGPVPFALDMVGWAAAGGVIVGSLLAIAQRDFWRMLAYSSVAQMSLVVLGLSLGNVLGLIGALLHILSHAIMKGCLFMVAGAVRWREGARRIPEFAGMSRRMPLTMGALFIASMSMIGLPPTGGFFSKWYLVLGSFERGAWPFVVVIIASSLLNAFYFFRVIERAYLGRRAGEGAEEPATLEVEPAAAGARAGAAEEADEPQLDPDAAPQAFGRRAGSALELPAAMLIPILILGAAVILVGLFNGLIVEDVLRYALPWEPPL